MERRRQPRVSSPHPLPPADALGRELSDAVVLFHEAIATYLGMSATEWKCLGLLDQHGPLTAGRLADLSGLTTGAITGIAGRLESAGYVKREPHPKDKRSIVIRACGLEEIHRRIGPIFASLGAAMRTLAGGYTAAELASIQSYMLRMVEVLRGETAKLASRVIPPD
jgi:DNA-binding MarR family transcriptional regulator